MQFSGVKKTYRPPVLRKVTVAQLKTIVSSHAREFLELILPRRAQHSNDGIEPQKLTSEQAKLLLVGHASAGDRGAQELLKLISSEAGYSMEERP